MALVKKRLNIAPILTPGKTGQFDVLVDGNRVAERGGNFFTRSFGAGYPDLDSLVERLVEKSASKTESD